MDRDDRGRCPACGAPGGRAARSRRAVGTPFVECGQCGAFVPRGASDEWALMRPTARLGIVLSETVFALALGLAPALLCALFGLVTGRPLEPRTLALVAAAGLALVLPLRLGRLARDIQSSRQRMSDPMYRAKLVEFGIASRER